MRDDRHPLDIVATPGEDRSHCVIAFTGYSMQIMLEQHEFFRVTESLQYSRVLVRDRTQSWYQLLDGGPEAVFLEVAHAVRDLAPSTRTVVGASAGGFAAMLFGDGLDAQAVHAFGAQTTIERAWMDQHDLRFHGPLSAVWGSGRDDLFLDAEPHLGSQTKYHLHLCGERGPDAAHAARISRHPSVEIHSWLCAGHGVAYHLRDRGLLAGLLAPEAS